MDVAKYRALFVTEAREHLDGISKALLTLERAPSDRAALDELFRRAHSIKGMAMSMGYEPVAQLSHKLEDLAELARRGSVFDQEAVELWLEGSDWMTQMVALVEAQRESELAMPPMLDRVLQKTVTMMARVPQSRNVTHPRMAAVTAPTSTEPRLPHVTGNPTAAMPTVETRVPVITRSTVAVTPNANSTVVFAAVAPREWDVEVVIHESSTTPHVRAFLVHKRISEKLEVTNMVPALADLKRGVLENRTLKMTVRGTLDDATLTGMITSMADVASARVLPVAALTPTPTPAPIRSATQHEAAAAAAARTVRVRTELLDELIDSVGEILLARSRLRIVSGRLEDPDLRDLSDEFTRLAQGLHDRVMSARMIQISVLTDRLPRVVRDLAKKRGRDVDFKIEGGSIELDRAVLDELHDPVNHLVRNSVDHAHEGDSERVALGKSATMELTLTASRDRDHVLITLNDDGRGMDPERLRQSAVGKGIITAEAARLLNDQQALELICKPGFSTAEEVNDTSGRGVGMDVVRAKVEQLGGQLLIESVVGKGSTFTLRLPLTVAIIRVLLVSADGGQAVYALPLHRVDHALDFNGGLVVGTQDGAMYPVADSLVPLHDLTRLLGHDVPAVRPGGAVVVLERPFRHMAVRVERIMGQQEVVVKPLGPPLAQVPYLAGAALLADGRPAYILDVAKLVDEAQADPPALEPA